jgi:hypothetical protein
MVLALAEGMAAWNCELQSEKSILAAEGLAEGPEGDGLAGAELIELLDVLTVELVVLAGVAARLDEVQAGPASSATPTTSTDRRVPRRVGCTR